MSLRLSRAPVRVGCTHARSATLKDCRAGQPSWLTSSRASSTQPRNADFLVAIAPYFLLLLSPILSLIYPPPGAPSLPPCRADLSFFPSRSSLLAAYASSTARRRVQTFAFRLRNEARHPTRDTCKMAEFNRKALFAGRSRRGSRGGPPILIALISIPFPRRLRGEGICLSTLRLLIISR